MDRARARVPCGPGGEIRDYVGFYFGPRSPMLYRIHTGWGVKRVDQSAIAYLVSSAQVVASAGLRFVFTDRHSLARVASFSDRLDQLGIVDFDVAYAEQWSTTPEYPDRQEKKQAEFLVHGAMPWPLVGEIGVLNQKASDRVRAILAAYPDRHRPRVFCEPSWYYRRGRLP
ncbi:MAG: DUF4433 domain-containing protein [Phycisphaerales bacterium]|nr:MAG: DUF4433 domain-containing protein [Phycisphaerales bacterium]